MGWVRADSTSFVPWDALHELLDTRRDVTRIDAQFGRTLLAVGLSFAELVSYHDRFHDLQGCPQVGRPVAVAEVGD